MTSHRDVMGEQVNTPLTNIVAWSTMVVTLLAAIVAIVTGLS